MWQQGRVVERLPDGQLCVEVERAEACGACRARALCTGWSSPRALRVTLDGGQGARPGDAVGIACPDRSVLGACALAYLVPVAGLVAGAWLGARVPVLTSSPDLATALGALFGLALGFVPLWWAGRRGGTLGLRLAPTDRATDES